MDEIYTDVFASLKQMLPEKFGVFFDGKPINRNIIVSLIFSILYEKRLEQ